MDQVLERIKDAQEPAAARAYELPGLRLLVALCCALQRSARDAPFFLSCRTAGRLLDVDHTTAWRWLYLMVSDGLLEVAERGQPGQKRATRYRYVAG